MTKNEIISKLGQERTIETIIANVSKGSQKKENTEDLAQDLYTSLLSKPDELIEKLNDSNQLQFFVTRMVLNSVYSTHSRYYYDYLKYDNNKNDLQTDIPDNEQ